MEDTGEQRIKSHDTTRRYAWLRKQNRSGLYFEFWSLKTKNTACLSHTHFLLLAIFLVNVKYFSLPCFKAKPVFGRKKNN